MSYTKPNFCNNCGKYGHSYHQCKLPIISTGIILVSKKNDQLYYLMIRRKDTLGYVDFLRGRYTQSNQYHLKKIIYEMTTTEQQNLLTYPFQTLWKQLWSIDSISDSQYKQEQKQSDYKFNELKKNDTLAKLIKINTSNWKEPEWGFPKGRRNYLEKDIDCALREFEEETGISKDQIILLQNVMPYEEIFIGSNFKSYKHKYFVAFHKDNSIDIPDNFQKTEVSKIAWLTHQECLHKIRPYNLEKKDILNKIHNVLRNYSIY